MDEIVEGYTQDYSLLYRRREFSTHFPFRWLARRAFKTIFHSLFYKTPEVIK